MDDEIGAVEAFVRDLLAGIPNLTLVLGAILLALVIYALFRTLSGSRGEIRKGKIARFQQFLQDLRWRINRLKLRHPDGLVEEEALLALLRQESEAPIYRADWDRAYALERSLIEHYTEADEREIVYDYSRNLEQARAMGLAEFAVYEGVAADAPPLERKLALSKLVADMQWARAEAYAKRKVAVAFVSRTGFLVLICGVSAGLFLYFDPPFDDPGEFSGLDFAVISGAFGASFFMLANSQNALRLSSYSDIRRSLDWPLLLIRLAFGAAAAAALYFFFETDLLSGQLTPTLKEITYESIVVVTKDATGGVVDAAVVDAAVATAPAEQFGGTRKTMPQVPNRHMALLFFWSFLAGFSERLVPSLLRGKRDEIAPLAPNA